MLIPQRIIPSPPQDNGQPYSAAAKNNDLATLRCLRRLGCPWGPHLEAVTRWVWMKCEFPVLRWLVEAGCPVNWDLAVQAAVKAAGQRTGVDRGEVLAWLAAERQQRLGSSH